MTAAHSNYSGVWICEDCGEMCTVPSLRYDGAGPDPCSCCVENFQVIDMGYLSLPVQIQQELENEAARRQAERKAAQ